MHNVVKNLRKVYNYIKKINEKAFTFEKGTDIASLNTLMENKKINSLKDYEEETEEKKPVSIIDNNLQFTDIFAPVSEKVFNIDTNPIKGRVKFPKKDTFIPSIITNPAPNAAAPPNVAPAVASFP